MKTQWSTSTYTVDDRAEAIRQTIRDRVVPVHIALPERPEDVHCEVSITGIGRVQLSTVRASPATVERSLRLAAADWEPCLFLSLQRVGTSSVVQDGRAAAIRPGTLGFYDTRRPYTLLFDGGVDTHFFRIPVAELGLPDAVLGDVTARVLGDGDSVAALGASYLSRLAAVPDLHSGPAAEHLAATTLEMVRAVIADACDLEVAARAAREETLGPRILEYLRRHLTDRDLTPGAVAKAHHISLRHLYAVLAREGVSPGEWIRRQRLEGARRELAAPGSRRDTIAAVAHRWGFTDASRFGRSFKEAYGMTPREYRDRPHAG
ncbi:helix-turn-helix domain-containing protein [Streptomyces arenae]|uniref:helix-turn-helix domain-containing protein n=1 Tax=Streptomyces arenae TaxID=29301 RepID=UPI00265A27D6|nr:helix-turn-helix domain-containing protein [Streptomyces arenae]MCG7210859.1 helix-turn-helix domain-containing protein [Streptomyces arenae]